MENDFTVSLHLFGILMTKTTTKNFRFLVKLTHVYCIVEAIQQNRSKYNLN